MRGVRSPLVLISPAMAIGAGYYRPLVAAFEERGWQARALPRRGFGSDQEPASRENDWSWADEIAVIEDAVATARAGDPDRPVIVFGHSMGSQMIAGQQINGTAADGFVAIGASVPWFRVYQYSGLHILGLIASIQVATRVYGFIPPPVFGAPGARTLMRQWAGFALTARPPYPVPQKVTTPTLVLHLQGDALAVSKSNKEFIKRLIDPSVVTRRVITRDEAGEDTSLDHIGWVRTPDHVIDHVMQWWATVGVADTARTD